MSHEGFLAALVLLREPFDAAHPLLAQVEACSGSISAERGIGRHKKPCLGASRSADERAAMRAIRQAPDPLHLLNPGKVFDL